MERRRVLGIFLACPASPRVREKACSPAWVMRKVCSPGTDACPRSFTICSFLLRITKAEMVRILHKEPELSEMFTSFLLARNARIQADLVDQLFNSSEKRLAMILLLLAQFGKESKPETVVPKISQEVLAGMIGTTRSRVSFFMNRFRKLGFVEYNGKIRVHNTLLNIFLQE